MHKVNLGFALLCTTNNVQFIFFHIMFSFGFQYLVIIYINF
jgi:hypothetical protein